LIQPIFLAAGRSARFGANKLLHPLADGTPLALAAARNLAAALPGALAVVNGTDAELVGLLEGVGLKVSVCPHAQEGMGASLAWGVSQTPEADRPGRHALHRTANPACSRWGSSGIFIHRRTGL
jgi:molybdenum cofactor cytidylyltransferase